MSNNATRAEHQAQVQALTFELVEFASKQPSHSATLEALICAYAAMAVTHPCCAAKAADLALNVSALIATKVPRQTAPQVH